MSKIGRGSHLYCFCIADIRRLMAQIRQQGDAGLDNTSKFFGNRLAHNSSIWTFTIEHSGEHYGQLVVYYRANNLVPPDSRH